MRVSTEWLKTLVDIDCSVADLADKLTMAGIAVEAVENQADRYQGMVVAEVLELHHHQQADNLYIAKLNAGERGIKQVITAAKNLKPGDRVPLALVGAILPNGNEIMTMNFKGVLSQGMMCSGTELGLEKESAGIWVFDTPVAPGQSVAEALGETDQILVLELTANRGDCLGMIGVAREVAAICGSTLKEPSVELDEKGPSVTELAEVIVADPELCLRYAARVMKNITIAPAPGWMQRRLRAAGIRPINNIVDITNYVMLEYNQPLHAFDYDRIAEHRIIVRRAHSSEKLRTLDDVERNLGPDNLLIADAQTGLCVAGVMGGSSSEVSPATINVFLEAACFNPLSIRKTAKELDLKTESSYRFERGIDPNAVIQALNRAAYLMQTLANAKVSQGYLDVYPSPAEPVVIKTSYARINAWLGTDLPNAEIRHYLEQVVMTVVEAGEQIEVGVPSFRRDIHHMADLAEEVARLSGYDRIPVTIPRTNAIGERTLFQKFQQTLRRALQGNGLSEIITYSLYSKATYKRLGLSSEDRLSQTVDLMIPLNEDQAVMRTTLVHGMLEALAFNIKRRQIDLALFEIARVYYPKKNAILPEEILHLSIGLTGCRCHSGWNQARDQVDFYDIKGIVELIADKFNLPMPLEYQRSARPYLHPGQSAEVFFEGESLGYLGQIHPKVATEYELTQPVFFLELNLNRLAQLGQRDLVFKALPKYPAIERDLALVLPLEIQAQDVIRQIRELGGALIEKVELFDVYQGEQVLENTRSLAFHLTYRSMDRTLQDQEVQEIQSELLKKLHQRYGATVRG